MFEELIAKLKAAVAKQRERANEALRSMQPLEALEVGEDVSRALRAFNYNAEELQEISDFLDRVIPAHTEASTTLVAAAEQRLLTEGIHVTASDRDAQVQAARDEGRTEAEQTFQAQEAQRAAAATRREELTETIGARAARAIPDETLAGDEHALAVTAMQSRLAAMKAANITEESMPQVFGELVDLPLTDEGAATFKARIASYQTYAEALRKTSPAGVGMRASRSTPPAQGAASGANGAEANTTLGYV